MLFDILRKFFFGNFMVAVSRAKMYFDILRV